MSPAVSDLGQGFRERLATIALGKPEAATAIVEALLSEARAGRVSDIHLDPSPDGLVVRWRVDGVLHSVATLPQSLAPNVVARLKILAELLTYRNDQPQEGRIRVLPGALETRVCTFPTLHGERAVIRLFADPGTYHRLDDLGLPADLLPNLKRVLNETGGCLVISGPAGSGKTTTLYACLREILAHTAGARSLCSLEDPIEVALPGVAQAQVNPATAFTLESGLRSLLRQDPEVIAVGEMRDRGTAQVALQAALSGHLVMTTFHAGSAVEVLGRLMDMGLEPYALRSGLLAILSQRLLRRLCDCRVPASDEADFLGLPAERAWLPAGCEHCRGTGYAGRLLLAELAYPGQGTLATRVLKHEPVSHLHDAAIADGMVARWQRGVKAVESGLTSPAELRRTLGFQESEGGGPAA